MSTYPWKGMNNNEDTNNIKEGEEDTDHMTPPPQPLCQDSDHDDVIDSNPIDIHDDNDDDESIVLMDLAPIYAASDRSRHRHRNSMGSRSFSSSVQTDWSTPTTKISNTSTSKTAWYTPGGQSRQHHQHQQQKGQQQHWRKRKRQFLEFTKVLMKMLERKDPKVYRNAQTVIRQCEEQKRNGITQSVTSTMKTPLRQAVGCDYWHEAHLEVLKQQQQQQQLKRREQVNPEDGQETPIVFTSTSQDHSTSLSSSSGTKNVPRPHTAKSSKYQEQKQQQQQRHHPQHKSLQNEIRLRKKRKWMIIAILMKYLQRNDVGLYQQAKDVIDDCLRRHQNKEEGYDSLSGSIQISIKQQIGSVHWRRAESFVHKRLLSTMDEQSDQERE